MVADSLAVDSLMVTSELPDDLQQKEVVKALNHWFASSAHINPNDIQIPIEIGQMTKVDPDMCNGLYYEQAIDGGYFAAFLTPNPGRAENAEVGPVNGVLTYDADSVRFVITDTQNKDADLTLDSRGTIRGQGTYDLGLDLSLVDFALHGAYVQNPNDSLTISGLNVFNAPIFDDKTLEAMAEVYSSAEGESIDLTKTQYLRYFGTENSEEKTEERSKAIELEGYPSMGSSDFYAKTIVIPDLKMEWNDQLHAFVSVGKIGLGNLGNHVVNKYVDGYVVFDHRLGNITYFFQNDMFMTYLNYNCGDGQLQVHATYSDINQRLADTKEKSRTVSQNDKRFQYVAVPYESMLDFLNRLRYAGLN